MIRQPSATPQLCDTRAVPAGGELLQELPLDGRRALHRAIRVLRRPLPDLHGRHLRRARAAPQGCPLFGEGSPLPAAPLSSR